MAEQKYKRPAIYPETYKQLEYYRLDNDLETTQEAVAHLLDRVEGLEDDADE